MRVGAKYWLAAQPGFAHAAVQFGAEVRRELVAEMQVGRRQRSTWRRDRRRQSPHRRRPRSRLCVPLRPASRAGAAAIHSPIRSSSIPRCCMPVQSTGSARPRLAMPPHAWSQRPSSRRFISGGQGEWSVVTMSIRPSFERIPQRLAIPGIANWRRAFVFRCAVGNLRSVEPEIMCAGFNGDGHAALARIPAAAAAPRRWTDARYGWGSGTLLPGG